VSRLTNESAQTEKAVIVKRKHCKHRITSYALSYAETSMSAFLGQMKYIMLYKLSII